MKNKTEEQWSKVDCDTMLGTRQSFRQRDLQLKSLYFESAEEARIRSRKRKALEEAGLRKKKATLQIRLQLLLTRKASCKK